MMGTFTHPMTLIGSLGSETVECVVDTGVIFTTVPAPTLERLGVEAFTTIRVRFADGKEDDWRMGQLEGEIDGTRRPILWLFGSVDAPPLLGAHALEAFLLTVDPAEQKLVRKEAWLL